MRHLIALASTLLLFSCGSATKESATTSVSTLNDSEIAGTDSLLFLSHYEVDSVEYLKLVMNPEKAYLSFVDSVLPSISDSTIALCVEAAFTGELLEHFSSTNIAGDYIIDGVLHKGYECNDINGFVCVDSAGIPFISDNGSLHKYLKECEGVSGTTLFQQMLIIQDGLNVYRGFPIKPATQHIYRAACIMNNGSFAIIQSLAELPFERFISALLEMEVKDALYLDMGTGWNYGWYRLTQSSPAVEFFQERTPFQTNWLLVKAR